MVIFSLSSKNRRRLKEKLEFHHSLLYTESSSFFCILFANSAIAQRTFTVNGIFRASHNLWITRKSTPTNVSKASNSLHQTAMAYIFQAAYKTLNSLNFHEILQILNWYLLVEALTLQSLQGVSPLLQSSVLLFQLKGMSHRNYRVESSRKRINLVKCHSHMT